MKLGKFILDLKKRLKYYLQLNRSINLRKKKLWNVPPLQTEIYIYIHTHRAQNQAQNNPQKSKPKQQVSGFQIRGLLVSG